jgi:hypothetical protein
LDFWIFLGFWVSHPNPIKKPNFFGFEPMIVLTFPEPEVPITGYHPTFLICLIFVFVKKLIFLLFYLFEQSKGGILEKTVQYLLDMKEENIRLVEHIKNLEKFKYDNEALKQQVNLLIFLLIVTNEFF